MTEENAAGSAKVEDTAKQAVPKIHWDDTNMSTCYANVVNASSTREEVTIFFGTNQTWNIKEDHEVVIKLSDRVILTPLAARRLWVLLGGVLKDYESKHGPLELRAGATGK